MAGRGPIVACPIKCLLPLQIPAGVGLYEKNIAICNGPRPCLSADKIAVIEGLLDGDAAIVVCSTKCLLPLLIAVAVGLCKIDIRQSRAKRLCGANKNIAAIAGLLDGMTLITGPWRSHWFTKRSFPLDRRWLWRLGDGDG